MIRPSRAALVVAGLAVAAGTGCGRGARPVAYAGAAVATAVGLYLIADANSATCPPDDLGCALTAPIGAGMELGAGAALTLAGTAALLGLIVTHESAEVVDAPPPPGELDLIGQGAARSVAAHTAPPAPTAPTPPTADPMLRQLTLQASTAARAGHCDAVRATASSVEERDPDYRVRGFVADAEVARCLADE